MKRRTLNVRTFDVPLPRPVTPESLASAKLGSAEAVEDAILEVTSELGLPNDVPRDVAAALLLARRGFDLDETARSLEWDGFEDFCATVTSAAGYRVRSNVRLRRPARQIDIVAESPSLVLVMDCKQWRRDTGPASLARAAVAQAERTRLLAQRSPRHGKAFLPVLLTLLDCQVDAVEGVPVVSLHRLREFLSSVSRFDGLQFFDG